MEDRISELTKEKEFKNNLVRIEQRKKNENVKKAYMIQRIPLKLHEY